MFGKYKNNKLVVVDTLETVETMKAKGFFVVPNTVIAGQEKEYYNKDFSLKTIETLIEEKIIVLKPQEKVFDNKIISKTDNELYLEGLKDLPENMKIEKNEVLPKTIQELYRDDLISRDEFLNNYVRPIRNNLLNEADLIYCNALNLLSMSEAKKKEWNEYKQKLKDYTDIATAESDFPIKPKE